jgi:hypothetical protein
MTALLPTHYLDFTETSLMTGKPDPKDLGWGVLGGPLAPNTVVQVNGQPYEVLGFNFKIQTVPGPPTAESQMHLPVLEVMLNLPGRKPAMTGLVRAGPAPLPGLGGARN